MSSTGNLLSQLFDLFVTILYLPFRDFPNHRTSSPTPLHSLASHRRLPECQMITDKNRSFHLIVHLMAECYSGACQTPPATCAKAKPIVVFRCLQASSLLRYTVNELEILFRSMDKKQSQTCSVLMQKYFFSNIFLFQLEGETILQFCQVIHIYFLNQTNLRYIVLQCWENDESHHSFPPSRSWENWEAAQTICQFHFIRPQANFYNPPPLAALLNRGIWLLQPMCYCCTW